MRHAAERLLMASVVLGLASFAAAETFSTDFESYYQNFPGFPFQDTGLWWGPVGTISSGYSTICSSCGVGNTAGVTGGPFNYHWIEHYFEWQDPTIAGVVMSMDFETPVITNTSFPFTKDRVGWTINPYGTETAEWFQVSLEKASSGVATIKGNWYNAVGTERQPTICTYTTTTTTPPDSMTGNTFYRLRMAVTKLNSNYRTPVRIDVTLTEVNADGSLGTQFASGSIADTSTLAAADMPRPELFLSAKTYMTERNPNASAKGDIDNASVEIVRIATPDCLSSVTPYDNKERSAEANIGGTPNPSSFEYNVNNLGLNSLNYTVTELDDQMVATDVSWLSVDKTGGTVAAAAFDTVTASLNTAGLAQGKHHAYLKFTDSCTPPLEHIRRVDLTVYGCRWTLDSCSQERQYSADYPTDMPENVVYRITNTGDYPINYSVAKSGDTLGWLNVTNGTGTVAVGQYVDVVSQFNPAVIASSGDYNCSLTFSDDCSPQTVTRNIRLRYLTAGNTHVFEYQGNVDPTATDAAGTGRKFTLYEGNLIGSVADDVGAIDGKVWRMIDSGSNKSRYRAQYLNGTSWSTIPIYGESGNTMVARLKVNSWGGTHEGWISLEHSDASSASFFWGGSDGMAGDAKRDIYEQSGYPSSGFVTLWIASKGEQIAPSWPLYSPDEWTCGRTVDLYLLNDNQQILWQKHITSATAEGADKEGFFFGDNETAGMLDVSYDWITGTNVGAFAPGEEVAVLGRSLFVSAPCVIPFPDPDGDLDVDMADFAVFQRCYSPTVAVTADCRCYDRDHDGYVDEDDLTAFIACAGGPGVFFDAANPPVNCHP